MRKNRNRPSFWSLDSQWRKKSLKPLWKSSEGLWRKRTWVAMSGSVPKGLDGTAYQKLVKIVKGRREKGDPGHQRTTSGNGD